jgi:hypothetical protein
LAVFSGILSLTHDRAKTYTHCRATQQTAPKLRSMTVHVLCEAISSTGETLFYR